MILNPSIPVDGTNKSQKELIMTINKSLLLSTAAVFMLSGCYNEPGLVEDQSYNRTKTGALTGALAGAAIGYNTKGHHKGERAVIGALVGAALGGAVGYSLDEQANEIARALGTGVDNDPLAALDPNKEIIVSKHPTHVKIMFRDKMMFATDSATLQPSAREKVKKIGMLLANYPQTVVGVAGFTDDRGSYEYNLKLSERRARSVANLLAVNGRPLVKGCSWEKPIAPNDSAKNRALNRRVEVYLYADRSQMTDPCR
jgi:outer membrane protein OmpA-like peptidoglycan-associated protein